MVEETKDNSMVHMVHMAHMTQMQVRCLKCAGKRELSDEETQDLGKYIDSKKLKGIDYLEKISLDAGYTCKNDTKHKYTFVEGFDDTLHEKAEIIDNDTIEIESTEKNIANLDEQIKKMMEQREEENKKVVIIKEMLTTKKNVLIKMTGSENYKLWLRNIERIAKIEKTG